MGRTPGTNTPNRSHTNIMSAVTMTSIVAPTAKPIGRVARHQFGAAPATFGKGNGSKTVMMSRWKGMDEDISDDQQDIARGRNMVDSKFQGGFGLGGTHNAVMSSSDYISGRMGGATQYTVNNQMVNATLMNLADNPTNVQLPGQYQVEEIPRVPIIATGNDFSTLYAPLIRDGRMEKFYWSPTFEDRVGVACGIFKADGVAEKDVEVLCRTFDGQSIDFFGALRARVYDDKVREWISETGIDNMGPLLVNPKRGNKVSFEAPRMSLDILLQYGKALEMEQENVKRVQLADAYLDGAVLAGEGGSSNTARPC